MGAVVKRRASADRVDSAEKPADPGSLLLGTEFRPPPPPAREHRIAKPAMEMKRLSVAIEGRDHGNLLRGEFGRECMLFADGGIIPAPRAVELCDHRRAVLDAD